MSTNDDELTTCQHLADTGHPPSMRRLAELHELHNNHDTALTWWHKAAAAGDKDAQLYLETLADT